jgi:iron only hydrogenase large subunit-like protein
VTLCRTNGSSSGGYLSWILRYAVKHLYGVHLSPQDIEEGRNGVEIKIGRNSDYKQVSYRPEGSLEATLRFAYVYGFRNIQNLVRKVKQNRGPVSFHFVEVMACPSGCINGGGQSRPEGFETKQVIPSEWIQSAEQVYRDVSLPLLDPDQNESVIQLYNEWIGGDVAKTVQFLQTEFRAVEAFKSASLAVQW